MRGRTIKVTPCVTQGYMVTRESGITREHLTKLERLTGIKTDVPEIHGGMVCGIENRHDNWEPLKDLFKIDGIVGTLWNRIGYVDPDPASKCFWIFWILQVGVEFRVIKYSPISGKRKTVLRTDNYDQAKWFAKGFFDKRCA